MIELMMDGFKSIAPFEDCSKRNTVQESDWGTSIRIASSNETLKFGYQEEQDGARQRYGYYVANKREGVWLTCAARANGNETLRTRYSGGVEIGPRQYLKDRSIYKTELLRDGKAIARILVEPDGDTTVSEIDRDRDNGLVLSRSDTGGFQLATSTAGTRSGLQIDGFGRAGADIGIVERGKVVQSFPGDDFSGLLTGTTEASPIGYSATVEPYFSGVFKAPYPGTFDNRMKAPVLDELLGISGKVLWNTRSERAPYDLRPAAGQLKWNVSASSTVAPLSPPSIACLPDAALRSNSDSLLLVPAAIRTLDLYTPDGLSVFKRELDGGLTEDEIQILRWSHPNALRWTDNDIRERAAADFPVLQEAITRAWSTAPCRRALLYWGYFRPVYPQLHRTAGVPPALIKALHTGQPSREERALAEILRRRKGLMQTDEQVFEWLQSCVGEDGERCDRNMKFSFEQLAWIQAKELGLPHEFQGGVVHQMDRVSITMASELLASLWIDEFHQQYASMLIRAADERIAFVEKMQGDVIAASNWAGRMQVMLLWPWTTQVYKEPRDYQTTLELLMEHPAGPPTGFTDLEQELARKWYDDEKAIAEAAPMLVQSDLATASGATDMFLDYLKAIVDAADRENGDITPDEAAVTARILASGLPDETIEVQDQFVPSGSTAATSDALFSYTSDDYFKISFTVPRTSGVVKQIAGSPIGVALMPAHGLDPTLLVCGGDQDQRCLDPSAKQVQLLLARLVLSGTVETRTIQPDGSALLSVVVSCGDRCRTLPGRGISAFEPPASPFEPSVSDASADDLLQFVGAGQLQRPGVKTRLSGNLLKSSGPWIAVPLLAGGAIDAQRD